MSLSDSLTRMNRRWVPFTLRHSKGILAVYGALLVLAGLGLTNLRFDETGDVFFDQTTPQFVESKAIEKEFGGSGGEAIVTLTAEDIFTPANLQALRDLSDRLESLDGVEKVISLTTVTDTIGEKDNFRVEKLVPAIPEDAAGCQALRERAMGNPLYVKNVISADGKTAGILVKIGNSEGKDAGGKKRALIAQIRRTVEEGTPAGLAAHVTGNAPMDVDYMTFMQHDMSVFLPLSLALMTAVLYGTFRSVRLMFMPMVVVTTSLLFTMSLTAVVGYKLNSVTVVVPPVIMGVVIGDSMHYVSHALRHRAGDASQTLAETSLRMLFPCLMTTVTTCAGFLSLLTSRSPAMFQLGVIAAAGTMLAYGVTFTLLPAVMKHAWPFEPGGDGVALSSGAALDRTERAFDRLSVFYARHKGGVVLAAGALGLLSLAGISRIRVESSLLEQLKKSSAIYRSTVFVEQRLTGIEQLYVSMRHARTDGFKDPAALRQVEAIREAVAAVPGVDKVLAVTDFLKDMNRSFHDENPAFYALPKTRQMVAQYALLYDAKDLEDYMDPGWQWTVVRARLTEHVSSRLTEICRDIRERIRCLTSDEIRVTLSGPVVTEVEGVDTVVKGQIWSLLLAMLIVFAIMFLTFRSVSAGWISVVPNLLPLATNFGIMGLFGIKLDPATSIISAIGIGIIVDNTIHFVHGLRENLRATGGCHREAVRRTLVQKGKALTFTAVILVCSFGVLIFSEFVPVFQFGLLCIILMVTAWAGDVVLLPCLALWARPQFPRSGKGGQTPC